MAGGLASRTSRRDRLRGRRGGRRTLFAEINITPLTDVVFVLLIIFMVTAQFMDGNGETGLDVTLPTATEVEDLDSLGGLRVRIDRDGLFTVDGRLTDPEHLAGALARRMVGPEQLVIVEGDRETVLQNVVAVMDAALSVGLPNVVIATAADPNEPFHSPPAPAAATEAGGEDS